MLTIVEFRCPDEKIEHDEKIECTRVGQTPMPFGPMRQCANAAHLFFWRENKIDIIIIIMR